MLDQRRVPYRYRDYRTEPLAPAEIRALLRALGLPARDVLRRNAPEFRTLGLTGQESDQALIPLIAQHPTLLQRPIGVSGGRALIGRPPERLLALAG